MPKISIVLPTHNMANGKFFLKRALDSIAEQTHKDFEVVIPDNSHHFTRTTIGEIVKEYSFPINHFINERMGATKNTNDGMGVATGDLIKILHMDDFFAHQDALKNIVENFKGHWLVTGCTHTKDHERYNDHLPQYNDKIHTGMNTIGSPSVLTIKNGLDVWFDEDSVWLFDCLFYKKMYEEYGAPTILNDINVVIGIHAGQATNQLTQEQKQNEVERYV